jgi:hypothetical protein
MFSHSALPLLLKWGGGGLGGGRGGEGWRPLMDRNAIGKSWIFQSVLVEKTNGLCLGVVGGKRKALLPEQRVQRQAAHQEVLNGVQRRVCVCVKATWFQEVVCLTCNDNCYIFPPKGFLPVCVTR